MNELKLAPPNDEQRKKSAAWPTKALNYIDNNVWCRLIIKLWQMFGWSSAAIAAGVFIYNYVSAEKSRVTQSHFQAWSLINAPATNGTGQKEALELLVKDKVNLSGIKMQHAYLENARLHGIKSTYSDFSYANLIRANLSFSSFTEANFDGAQLNGASMIAFNNSSIGKKPIMARAHFDLKRAQLYDPRDESPSPVISDNGIYYSARFIQADLSDARLVDADLRFSPLIRTNLNHALLYRANLEHADLTEANLDGADISLADFGDGRDSAKVTQAQIDRTCYVEGMPPKLPSGFTLPKNVCSHQWKEE